MSKDIDISMLKNSSIIRVGLFQIKKLATSTLETTSCAHLVDKLITGCEVDLKNRIVQLTMIEDKSIDFFKVLNNLLASKDMKLYITSKSPVYDGNTKTYESKYPHFCFYDGNVTGHNMNTDINEDVVCTHVVTIKFARFQPRYDEKDLF